MNGSADPMRAFREEMLAALGHAPEVIEPGRPQRFPTCDRARDDAGWCLLFPDLRGGVFWDHRTGASGVWKATESRRVTRAERLELARQVAEATRQRAREQRERWAESARRIARLWAQCAPLTPGDPATLYLKRRGFGGVWPLSPCLRLHQAMPYWDGDRRVGDFPAMVAPLIGPDGRTVALHRTFLTRDGRKAEVPTVRKVTPAAGSLAGACIPLFKPDRGRVGIAEGIETALAAWCGSGLPTVAAYSAGSLEAWQWPAGLRHLVIFADNDDRGRAAAVALRDRAVRTGIAVTVQAPSEPGADWADVWSAREASEGVTGEVR